MKIALLLAILALSINAFAQRKHPTSNLQHSPSNFLENVQGMTEDEGCKTSSIYSERNLEDAIKYQTPQQRSLIQIYDSIYNWEWDTISIGWELYYKFINIVYDANNNLTSKLDQDWEGSSWVNHIRYTLTYDDNNNQTTDLSQDWDGSAWVDRFKYTYTYDANNNRISALRQYWYESYWKNSYQETYTYDANNNRTSYLIQIWNGSDWENDYKTEYTYDANNNRISGLTQCWYGSYWENYYQFVYIYDASNNLTNSVLQKWNYGIWENYYQYVYTYDANNNRISGLWKSWYEYDWLYPVQYTWNYDANNFLMSSSVKYWDADGTEMTRGDSTYYYYHTVVGINDLMVPVESITVYPNPSCGKFTISSNRNLNSIEIYNLLGERLYSDYQLNRQKTYEIDLTAQAKGIYFIIIYSGTNTYSRKIIVQ